MNATKIVLIMTACAVSCGAFAHEWSGDGPDYSFGTADSPLATGELPAPANVQVHSLSVYPAEGATVTVTNGPIALQGGATLSNGADGTVVLATDAVGTDGVCFSRQIGNERTVSGLSFSHIAGTVRTVAPGMTLADWEIASATSVGKSIGAREMLPYNEVRTNGVYEVQLKWADDSLIKGVKLRLWQDGADVVGTALYARYASYVGNRIDVDLDETYVGDLRIAENADAYDYGIQALVFRKRSRAGEGVLSVCSAITPNGEVKVNRLAVVAVEGAGAIGGNSMTATFDVAGELSFRDLSADTISLSPTLTGDGGTVRIGPWSAPVIDTELVVRDFARTDTKHYKVSDTLKLDEITGISDVVIKDKLGGAYHWTRTSDGNLNVQFQAYSGSYVMGVHVYFKQEADGLYAWRSYDSYYLTGSDENVGADMNDTTLGWKGGGSYTIQSFTLESRHGVRVNLGGVNAISRGTLSILSNACVSVSASGVLPDDPKSRVAVENGGELQLSGAGVCAIATPIAVQKGGLLKQADAKAVFDNGKATVILDGGVLDLARSASASITDDSGTYLKNLTVKNGGRVTGGMARVGYVQWDYRDPELTYATFWKFTGASPSSLESGVLLVGGKNRDTFVIEVDDVTGDGAVDMWQTGEVRDFGAAGQTVSSQYGRLRKRGVGTWLLDVACPGFFGELFVDAGMVLLGKNDVFPSIGTYATPAITLDGGTLGCAENVSNALPGFSLTENSGLSVAEGAALSFGDSSALAWTAGKRLTIRGLDKGTVRFGTSASSLTAAQIAAIRVEQDGKTHRALLDEQGYVKPYDPGMMILLR